MLTDEDKKWIHAEFEQAGEFAKAKLAQHGQHLELNETTLTYLYFFALWHEVRLWLSKTEQPAEGGALNEHIE
jgi:hypothetical protein